MSPDDTSIVVREATGGDVHSITRLITELAAAGGETSPVTEAYVEDYLGTPGNRVLLAESLGEVVGLLSYSVRRDLYHAGNSCLIEEVVVREDARRRGQVLSKTRPDRRSGVSGEALRKAGVKESEL